MLQTPIVSQCSPPQNNADILKINWSTIQQHLLRVTDLHGGKFIAIRKGYTDTTKNGQIQTYFCMNSYIWRLEGATRSGRGYLKIKTIFITLLYKKRHAINPARLHDLFHLGAITGQKEY